MFVVEEYMRYQKNQIGWQVGLSLEYMNYNISAYYSRDLRPIAAYDSLFFNDYYGSQFGIGLGYRFDMSK